MSLFLHFLRHGQTQSSRENLYCGGDVDAPLTAEGHEMAAQFAAAHAKMSYKAIYVSPLQRARHTAAPMQKICGLVPLVREELREIRYGAWDGKSVQEVVGGFSHDYRRWLADPAWQRPTGGESAWDVCTRALALLREVVTQHVDGDVLLVSHKATIRVALCGLLGIDVGQFRYRLGCPVASLSVVELAAQGPLLHRLADVSHLDARLRSLAGT